jgi:conjugal transfer mating pair stabilization protein TraG
MNYEIFSYGNVDSLSGLFNALAALMGGSAFVNAIAIVFVVGFFGAFMASAFAPDRLIGPKWLMSVILIYLVLFVPKSNVQVVDKVGGQAPAVIGNVPLGLAFQAGLTSSVGNTLTELFETALQTLPGTSGLPSDLTYTNHGLVFGAQVVTATQAASFTDMVFKTNVTNFLQNCTFYDISQGFISASVFATSNDIWSLLGNTNPARYATYTDATGVTTALPCPSVYSSIDNDMNATAVPTLMQLIGLQLNPALQLSGSPTLPGVQAASLLDQQVGAAYSRFNIADASTSAATIIRQNALIDSIHAANMLSAQASNDPSATMLGVATAQATIQANTQQIASGQIASQALPLIRNAIEAVIYGLFPFILLLALMMGGIQAFQLLKGYGLALIWIALWPPIYAIINYLDTMAMAKNAAANAYNALNGSQGLTLSTSNAIYGGMISDMAVVGYLVMSVPAIAGAVVFGLNKMVSIGAGFTTGVGQAARPGATAAASGNVGMGNVSFEQQQLDPNRSDAFMSTYRNLEGGLSTDVTSGDVRYQQNVGSNAIGLKSTSEVSNRFAEASSRSQAEGEDRTRQAEAATSVALDTALNNTSSHGTGTQGSAGYGAQHGSGKESSVAKLAGIRDQLARDLGITDSSQATSALKLSLDAGNDKSESNSAPNEMGTVSRIGKMVKAGIGATGQQLTDNQIQAAVRHARQSANDLNVQDVNKVMDNYTHSDDFKHLSSTNKEAADRINSSMGHSKSLRESALASFRQSDEYRQSAESLKSAALRGEVDWTPEFNRYLAKHHKQGVTGDEALKWANQFFHESGIGVGADGQPKAVLFDGAGPGNVTVTPGSYRDQNVLLHREQFAPLTVGRKPVTEQSLRGQNASNNAQVDARGTGAPLAPLNDDQLRAKYETERVAAQGAVDKGRVEAAEAREKQTGEFKDAQDHTSWFHNLGAQPDGRSAKQQLDKEDPKP